MVFLEAIYESKFTNVIVNEISLSKVKRMNAQSIYILYDSNTQI